MIFVACDHAVDAMIRAAGSAELDPADIIVSVAGAIVSVAVSVAVAGLG
jgi:hypothetical protein